MTRQALWLERTARQLAPELRAYFVRRVGSVHDADELLGEVFYVLASRPERIPTASDEARMWAFGIARRVLLAHRRRKATGPEWQIISPDTVGAPDPRGFPGDDSDAARREVRAAIAELTVRQREIVMLTHWEGFSLAEAAAHLRLRPSTVRTHYERARRLLRELLGASGPAHTHADASTV